MEGLELAYSQFMERMYYWRLKGVANNSPTYRHFARNAGKLEKLCQKLIFHEKKIIELSHPGSDEYVFAGVRLDEIYRLSARAQLFQAYKKLGNALIG